MSNDRPRVYVHRVFALAEPLPGSGVSKQRFLAPEFELEPPAGLIDRADAALRLGGAAVAWGARNTVDLIRTAPLGDLDARGVEARSILIGLEHEGLGVGGPIFDLHESRTEGVRYTVCVGTVIEKTTCRFCWLRTATNRKIAEPRCEVCAAEHDRQVRALLLGIGVGMLGGIAAAHVAWPGEHTPWYIALLGLFLGALAGGVAGWRLAARKNDPEVASLGEHLDSPPDDGRWVQVEVPDEVAEA